MRQPAISLAALTGALFAVSSTADAADVRIDMSLVVPEVCTVRTLSPATLEDNLLSLEVQELCNHGNYQVFLTYPPGTLKGAVVGYADRQIELDGSGSATLRRSTMATNRRGYLTIRLNEGMIIPSMFQLSTNAV